MPNFERLNLTQYLGSTQVPQLGSQSPARHRLKNLVLGHGAPRVHANVVRQRLVDFREALLDFEPRVRIARLPLLFFINLVLLFLAHVIQLIHHQLAHDELARFVQRFTIAVFILKRETLLPIGRYDVGEIRKLLGVVIVKIVLVHEFLTARETVVQHLSHCIGLSRTFRRSSPFERVRIALSLLQLVLRFPPPRRLERVALVALTRRPSRVLAHDSLENRAAGGTLGAFHPVRRHSILRRLEP